MLVKNIPAIHISFIVLATALSVAFPQPFKTQVNAQSTNLSASYLGVWEGNGTQAGSSWTISISLTPGAVNSVVGTISYPSLSCGGTLTLHRIKNQSIELDEKFTYGSEKCVPGRVVLQPSSDEQNQLEYKWLFPDGTEGATGSVRKIGNKTSPLSWYIGNWFGKVVQENGYSYSGAFKLKKAAIGDIIGMSEYKELGCGGELKLLSISEESLEFQETITYGTSKCLSGLRKTLTVVSPNILEYSISPDQGPYVATATLNRSNTSSSGTTSFRMPSSRRPAIDWRENASNLRGRLNQNFTFTCSPNGAVGSVWGTGIYTDDSSICSAAVHAGLITTKNGGRVTIRIRPGVGFYNGTNRNGVSSQRYGNWKGSFIFIK
jgi:LCCL domain